MVKDFGYARLFNICEFFLYFVSQGKNLNVGFSTQDIGVFIGQDRCIVIEKSDSILRCKPEVKEDYIDSQNHLPIHVNYNGPDFVWVSCHFK